MSKNITRKNHKKKYHKSKKNLNSKFKNKKTRLRKKINASGMAHLYDSFYGSRGGFLPPVVV